MKSYEANQKEKHVPVEREASGVSCSCKNVPLPNEKSFVMKVLDKFKSRDEEDSVVLGDCPGEMMFLTPKVQHPQLTNLNRAACGCCNWQGWV